MDVIHYISNVNLTWSFSQLLKQRLYMPDLRNAIALLTVQCSGTDFRNFSLHSRRKFLDASNPACYNVSSNC
jgi:hypothetical protein